MLAASLPHLLARLYFGIDGRTPQERVTLDVVALASVADVFDILLKGGLVTSGAVTILLVLVLVLALALALALALQNMLAGLFLGLVINATAPYRVGDHISPDDNTDGVMLEITWHAMHVLKRNQDSMAAPKRALSQIASRRRRACRHHDREL